ncbi:MAG: hypothetical protein OEW75_10840 [Cyclobacteriaceae bacterium]|nr:hypothetical protein [Cyclobacteriaceae bacterium]
MKKFIIVFFVLLIFSNVSAQNNNQVEVMKFISNVNDTITFYKTDIKFFEGHSFEVTNNEKVLKLKNLDLKEIFFVSKCCEIEKVNLQNVLSSSTPLNNLYILGIGGTKIQFFNDLFIECSPSLTQKLKVVIK